MMTDQPASPSELLQLTTQIVVAQLGHAAVSTDALPDLIRSVHKALSTAGNPAAPPAPIERAPAVLPTRSVFPDYIICLEDGQKYATLKRHLRTSFGLTPEQYRAKWKLPASYPMVAPNYSERRSAMAKQIGLGRKAAAAKAAAKASPASAKVKNPPTNGRKAKKA